MGTQVQRSACKSVRKIPPHLMMRLIMPGRSETKPSKPSSWLDIFREICRVSCTASYRATASLEVNAEGRGRAWDAESASLYLTPSRETKRRAFGQPLVHLLERLDGPIWRPVEGNVPGQGQCRVMSAPRRPAWGALDVRSHCWCSCIQAAALSKSRAILASARFSCPPLSSISRAIRRWV
jgi:hypothetical protein